MTTDQQTQPATIDGYDPNFFSFDADGNPILSADPTAFRVKFRDPTIDQFLGVKIVRTDPQFLAQYPDADKFQIEMYWKPVNRVIRRKDDNSVVDQIKDFVKISDAVNGQYRKTLASFEAVLNRKFATINDLNEYQGMIFERQELPLWGNAYNRENKDGSTSRVPTFSKVLRVVSSEEAQKIVPTDRDAGRPASGPGPAAQTQQRQTMPTEEVDEAVLAFVGSGATHAELLGKVFSDKTTPDDVKAGITGRTALNRLVEAGKLVMRKDRYEPASK